MILTLVRNQRLGAVFAGAPDPCGDRNNCAAALRNLDHAHTTDFHRFPFSNFKHFLTLFSKFFSSFPHGTCSLSVSRQYLALDEIYHPIRAAVPSNPTRRKRIVRGGLRMTYGVLTLYDRLVPKYLHPGHTLTAPL
jgi:hypothetical protein